MAKEYLDKNGLAYFWSKLKDTFALNGHTHSDYYTKDEVDEMVVPDEIVSSGYLVFGSKSISSDSDLNTYRTVGVYTCGSTSVAQTLTNCPVTSAFRLEVKQIVNADRYVQVLYANYSGHPAVYWRTYNGVSWSSWNAPALQQDVDVLKGVLIGGTASSSLDLNDYNTVGHYYTESASRTSTVTNKPTGLTAAFSMLVLSRGGNNTQVIFDYSGSIYIRGKISSGWQAWRKFSSTAV